MCIVNECDDTVPMSSDDPHMMVLLDGAKAELLQLARQQVRQLTQDFIRNIAVSTEY